MDGHVLELFLHSWRGDIIMLLGGKEGVEKIYEQLERIIKVAVIYIPAPKTTFCVQEYSTERHKVKIYSILARN
jgi:hypothetical protein